jgi:TRAP-type uncharacterized transport system fused permease subunit
MGLPTTANYVVVASLMATVLVDVGNASGFIFPLIAVHLFVFYFGLMADVTPPVGLGFLCCSSNFWWRSFKNRDFKLFGIV